MAISTYDHDFSGEKQEKTINNEKMETKELLQENNEKQNEVLKDKILTSMQGDIESLKQKIKNLCDEARALSDEKFKLEVRERAHNVCRPIGLLGSAAVAGLSGLLTSILSTEGIKYFGMSKHYPAILSAQQEYTNQITSEIYNEYGITFVANPSYIVDQIAHYSQSPLLDTAASGYWSSYASEVQTTLTQIAYDILGIDPRLTAWIGTGTIVAMFGGHVIGSKIARYKRKKKISALSKRYVDLNNKIDLSIEKCDKLKNNYEEIKNGFTDEKNNKLVGIKEQNTQLVELEEKKEEQEMGS
ncbi:MAG: hypothetical protein IJA22_03815 [Clostridia bacterium]|nr:hypothetical protein [Clostridia bacterium]